MRSSGRRKSVWRTIHRGLGIGLGVWFALVGVTGSILVYEEPIDAWLNPGLLVHRNEGPSLQPHEILERADREYPRARIERLRLPAARGEVYRLQLVAAPNRRSESPRIEATFSPVTGELLGTREIEHLGFTAPHALRTVYEFHRNVLLGTVGSNIVGIAGLLMLTSVVSGLAVAWPRNRPGWKRLVSVKLRAGGTRVLFDFHRSGGSILFVLVLVSTITGATLVYINYVREIVGLFSSVDAFPTIPWRRARYDQWPEFRAIVKNVRHAYPDRAIAEIHIPSQPQSGYLFYLRGLADVHRLGDTILWVHPATGEILIERSDRSRTRGETLMHWLFPLHSGSAFGRAGMVAMCFAGALPIFLALTGLWVWLRKRRAEKFESTRSARLQAELAARAKG
jgi:uncharacterized iron-regulated membrane protein